jgi:class 3 adenylate cyclase
MRRSLVFTFVIALVVVILVTVLHASGILLAPETWIANLVAPLAPARVVPAAWQYAFVLLLALGVTWFTIENTRRNRIGWVVIAISAELLALMWICALYRVSFQPLPCILAAGLSYAGTMTYVTFFARRPARGLFAAFQGRLSDDQISRLRSGEIKFEGVAQSFEASVLVCDIANKYDLADTSEPGPIAQTSETFNRRTSEILLNAGAYLEAADGEGVVAIFGFPGVAKDHAEKATRAAFDLKQLFTAPLQSSNGENPLNVGAHIGISSGSIVAGPTIENRDIFVMGEPIELARRFCVANRFYGSRILIGSRTFELANSTFVARPIDFLTGVSAQERHEVYEPLAVAADASDDLVARRDSFWNGVVLYREKRWAEAYNEFQKARGPADEEDAPLNLYLSRLEPLALHLLESPREERF